MSSHSDYRKATIGTSPSWDREMILEKAAYNLEQLGFDADALLLRRLRLGRETVLKDLIADLGIPDDEAEHDEGEEEEAFADE